MVDEIKKESHRWNMPLPGQIPVMPKNVAGPPVAGGSSPVTAPGAGAGNEAAATASVKSLLDPLSAQLSKFPFGSPKYNALYEALGKLKKEFGSAESKSIVPSAIQQMALASKNGSSIMKPPAPGAMPPDSGSPSPQGEPI